MPSGNIDVGDRGGGGGAWSRLLKYLLFLQAQNTRWQPIRHDKQSPNLHPNKCMVEGLVTLEDEVKVCLGPSFLVASLRLCLVTLIPLKITHILKSDRKDVKSGS